MRPFNRVLVALVVFPAIVAIGLAPGCSGSPSTVTPAQVAADLSGIVATLQKIEPLIIAADPGALSQAEQTTLNNDLILAAAELAKMSAGMPAQAGASEASRIDGYINLVMDGVAAAAAATPYGPPILAIDAVLPEIERFINQYLPGSMTVVSARRFAARVGAASMTPDQGRAALGIPVVHQ